MIEIYHNIITFVALFGNVLWGTLLIHGWIRRELDICIVAMITLVSAGITLALMDIVSAIFLLLI